MKSHRLTHIPHGMPKLPPMTSPPRTAPINVFTHMVDEPEKVSTYGEPPEATQRIPPL